MVAQNRNNGPIHPQQLPVNMVFHVQACEMDPPRNEIKTGLALLKELAGKKIAEPEVLKALEKLTQLWNDMVGAGATLLSGNRKMTKAVDELDTFFERQEGMCTLKAIVSTRNKLMKRQQALEKLAETFAQNHSVPEGSPLDDLIRITFPPAWEAELSAQPFDDAVSWKAAKFQTFLEDMEMKLKNGLESHYEKKKKDGLAVEQGVDYFRTFGLEGEQQWCKNIDPDATLDEIHDLSKSIVIAYLPCNPMKEFTENFLKVGHQQKWDASKT